MNHDHINILNALRECKAHAAIINESPSKDRRIKAAIALEAAANQLAALARAVQEAE